MSHLAFVHWILDFLGVNNTYDSFSTHMYNFWSGFGANISLLAVSGAIVGVYRHSLKRLNTINPVNLVHKIEEIELAKQKERQKAKESKDADDPHNQD